MAVKEADLGCASRTGRVILPAARYLDVTVRLLPRDEKFFDLFTAVATFTVEASRLQQDLLRAESNRRGVIVDQIKRLEHQADQVTHDVVSRLDRVFITPLDREDIHELASRLDDVMDLIDGTSRRLHIFHAGAAPDGAMLIADVIARATEQLQVAVAALEKNTDGTVLNACVQVKRLEEEGDSLYHEWVGRLFEGHPDALRSSSGKRSTITSRRRWTTSRTPATCSSRSPSSTPEHDERCGLRPGDRRRSRWSSISSTGSTTAPTRSPPWSRPGCCRRAWQSSGPRCSTSLAAFVVGTAVAKTIGKGLIEPSVVDPNLILSALVGAIVWNLITWYVGLPSSSSHALMGGLGGAAIAKAGFPALQLAGWVLPISFIFLSPLLGMALALGLTVGLSWLLKSAPPGPVDRVFRRLQLVSAALYSLSHGANDAQKTMGIIVGLLVSAQALFVHETGWLRHLHVPNADRIPFWVEMAAYTAIGLGTALGGWRIVKTMGSRITKLRPFGGFCAETAGGISILIASQLGVPVSTTHTITGAIVGVGAAQRVSAVRWGVATRIVWAWILTIPMSAAMAATAYLALRK